MSLQQFLTDLFARHYGKPHTPNAHRYTILYEAAHLWAEERTRHQRNIISEQSKEIAELKSKLNTDIPTLDRNSCTLPTGLTIQRVWVKPTRNDWDSIVSKCPYPDSHINTAWTNRIIYALICDLLSFHGFIHNTNGDMTRPSTGCSFSFECLSKYNSVEAFQKDWPYK